MMSGVSEAAYFQGFMNRKPPKYPKLGPKERALWHFFAGLTIMFGAAYLYWRWTSSLNEDALLFSVLVALAETAAFLGTLLFYFDIWDEGDTHPSKRRLPHSPDGQKIRSVDVFIATLDESVDVLSPTIIAASALITPPSVRVKIWLLDDGNRLEVRALAKRFNVNYLARQDNSGYKAGNLSNALYLSRADAIVICDADTQLLPSFLVNTIVYFQDPNVGWVQTPHWFFDIPPGVDKQAFLKRLERDGAGLISKLWARFLAPSRIGKDPFKSDSPVFFDLIQRRRNRNGASFCCGAGSIHRREALLQACIDHNRPDHSQAHVEKRRLQIQPFAFHVSEDLLTSIRLHQLGWTSVYHPKIEAKMLSPWTADAWVAQRLKYASGTFDIMLRENPLFRRNLPWRMKLHYASTFSSYAAILWLPVLVVAPFYSLLTGQSPINGYAFTFFAHFIPLIVCNEIALSFASKGYDTYGGRAISIGTLHLVAFALWRVILGQRPKFDPTPKTLGNSIDLKHARPLIWIMVFMGAALIWGGAMLISGVPAYSAPMLIVNFFWAAFTLLCLAQTFRATIANPTTSLHYVD